MGLSTGLPPIVGDGARVLVLGTLPSVISLRQRQYYANPQNAFWRIMERLFNIGVELAYSNRVVALSTFRIAVWDVCHAAHRPGSSDAAIRFTSIVPNDFSRLFRKYPRIRLVCFNGGKAASLYERRVMPTLPSEMQRIERVVLPSTSPANARMTFEQKRSHWSKALERVWPEKSRDWRDR